MPHSQSNTALASQLERNPIQELTQSVCQRYGWSSEITRDTDGYWAYRIIVGLDDCRIFVSSDNSSSADDDDGKKRGLRAAARAALDGLRLEIAQQEAKPTMELHQVFTQPIAVYDSADKRNWEYFWKHKPRVVGLDTEGNRIVPPVLVQIATSEYSILEVPIVRDNDRRCLSRDLERLLNDTTIVKVFCDNFDHCDKRCLGIYDPTRDWTQGHVVDLESIAAQWLGPTKTARGLARILSLIYCRDVLIRKPPTGKRFVNQAGIKTSHPSSGIRSFCLVEQGKAPPIRSLRDLTEGEIQYAALDAWCTLLAYTSFYNHAQSQTSPLVCILPNVA
jgi:hypothetical protein